MSRFNCTYPFFKDINLVPYSVISLFITLLVVFLYERKFKFNAGFIGHTGMLFLVFGSLLNIWERFSTGCVYDYLSFFGIFMFNVPDILITSGIMLAIINIWRRQTLK